MDQNNRYQWNWDRYVVKVWRIDSFLKDVYMKAEKQIYSIKTKSFDLEEKKNSEQCTYD